jgi:hypothetical protein
MRTMSRTVGIGIFILCCGAGTLWAAQGRGHAKGHASHAAGHDDKGGPGKGRGHDRDSYFERNGHTKLHIPPGHYPGPGECRVWYPGRPPGHQPKPVACGRLGAVPPGAWVLRHPGHDHEHVHVVVYDEHRPNSIFVVGEFKIATGVFVRVVVDR